ncbi:hypothetical protein E0K83_14750 [Gramella sp. BOM4]|nr:hypothetical protein [Christiangramia bathymodioli]
MRQKIQTMITSKIKLKLLPGFIQKAKKAYIRDSGSGSGRIGLILDFKKLEEKKSLFEFYGPAEYSKEDLKLVICGPRKEIVDSSFPAILDPSEISIGGKFDSEEITDFLNEKFDFLICYFSENCLPGILLAARSAARLKIGNSPDNFEVFDLEIEAENAEVFQQEALKYLEILKK